MRPKKVVQSLNNFSWKDCIGGMNMLFLTQLQTRQACFGGSRIFTNAHPSQGRGAVPYPGILGWDWHALTPGFMLLKNQ
jgi:hypothetical protein